MFNDERFRAFNFGTNFRVENFYSNASRTRGQIKKSITNQSSVKFLRNRRKPPSPPPPPEMPEVEGKTGICPGRINLLMKYIVVSNSW